MHEILRGVWIFESEVIVPKGVRDAIERRSLHARPEMHNIFNPDDKRFQMPIGKLKSGLPNLLRLAKRVERVLSRELSECCPGLVLHKGFVLESVGGCEQQAAHTDLDPTDAKNWKGGNDSVAPGGILFSLMEDTRLVVWETEEGFFEPSNKPSGETEVIKPSDKPSGETRVIEPRTIRVPAGRALYFRGDTVHAGASYAAGNVRLHWYVHVPGRRILNRRYDMVVAEWAGKKNAVFGKTRKETGLEC